MEDQAIMNNSIVKLVLHMLFIIIPRAMIHEIESPLGLWNERPMDEDDG